MKRRNLILNIAILFAMILTMSSCKIMYREVELRDKILSTLWINTPLPPEKIALLSFHGRFVYATNEDNWAIRQKSEVTGLNGCEIFTLEYRGNSKYSLRTCHGRYVTVPDHGDSRKDWMLRQDQIPGECGQFEIYEFDGKEVAFKTCAGRFITAGDNGLGWEGNLEWALVGDSDILDDWEFFTIETK